MIEQRVHVLRQDRAVVSRRFIELRRLAMPAIVERDDAAARPRERRHPAGRDPVHLLVGGKAVDEHDRLALAFIEKCDVHVVVGEARRAAIGLCLQIRHVEIRHV